jgi:hypothetical protein
MPAASSPHLARRVSVSTGTARLTRYEARAVCHPGFQFVLGQLWLHQVQVIAEPAVFKQLVGASQAVGRGNATSHLTLRVVVPNVLIRGAPQGRVERKYFHSKAREERSALAYVYSDKWLRIYPAYYVYIPQARRGLSPRCGRLPPAVAFLVAKQPLTLTAILPWLQNGKNRRSKPAKRTAQVPVAQGEQAVLVPWLANGHTRPTGSLWLPLGRAAIQVM